MINTLKSGLSFLICTRITCYVLYLGYFWVAMKAEFLSKIKIWFYRFFSFFSIGIFHKLFLSYVYLFLLWFSKVQFHLDGALLSLIFCIASCMKVTRTKDVYFWLCGFVQCANFTALKMDKLINFEVWSLNELDGNNPLTYMAMTISCQFVIIMPSYIMIVNDSEVPKIRVSTMLLPWVILIYPVYCFVASLQVILPKIR